MTPVVLGLGCSKFRHKLAALIHQMRVEVGNDVWKLARYCRSIVSFTTDMGVEAGLVDAPAIDLDHYLKLESRELRYTHYRSVSMKKPT